MEPTTESSRDSNGDALLDQLATDYSDSTSFHEFLGVSWLVHEGGLVSVEIGLRDDLRGPAGNLEGGVLATLVDAAAAGTAVHLMNSLVVTQQCSISFVSPCKIGPVRADGTPVHVGRHTSVVQVDVRDIGADSRLAVFATVTLRAIGAEQQTTHSSHAATPWGHN
jgi:uncharacterized protein (TIGR00369 family)